ncbi:membrane protein [Fervidicella metallireducens AeB]|uniref:UPF0182 protein Q428_12720 n=1 Tax=Fervidicella metallireducens AeB TaxID=1403537 RepID=A0A017RS54_9CLOT|nr:UPF0182 family protein [Fervidicella metallireducens]EYE87553.1 membrane protein [Fervidicella metallireducens AeB]
MRKIISTTIGIIIAIGFIISMLSGFIINLQWFNEVGYINVFLTELNYKIIIFIPMLIIIFLILNLYIRFLKKNIMRINSVIYDKNMIKKQNKIIMLVSILLSFILSLLFANSFWYKILEFYNGENFNIKDPIFKLDAGFFIFKLPLIESIISILTTLIVLLIIATFVVYIYEKASQGIDNIRGFRSFGESPLLRFIMKQFAIFGAMLLILFSAIFYIRTLNLVYSPRGVAFGASYTDIHVTLPMYRIISVLCLIAAVVVAIALIRKKIKVILFTAVFMVLVIVIEGLASGIVEKFIVAPNAKEKELPYLTQNIEFTRKAFGLDKIIEREFQVSDNITEKDITSNKDTIDNIRINEFSQSMDVFNQIQAVRNYYRFVDVDIDRYKIDGKLRQVFISARELDLSNLEPKYQTWQNKHLFFTHGYGAVMSYTNKVNSAGLPEFILKDIPAQGDIIKLDKPQIYFGELNNDYIIVNAKANEIDYPYGSENKENRYDGKAGIKLSLLNRFLCAINQGSANFLLSNDVTSESRIVLYRNVVDRIKKITPFINYDTDPYLVISNGKLYWIVDGYTTTNRYPYSEPVGNINYIRNSVKAVVDAYDGTVDFYVSDEDDAILKTIGKIYKGLLKNINDMPQDLRSHLRYSEDVFLTQAKVYEKYHMKNPSIFYNNEDLWSVPRLKGADQKEVEAEAVYQVMRIPGETKEELLLTIPFTVAKRENMVSWLAVGMDEKGFTNMTLIKFPKDKTVYGPQQINSKLNTDTAISKELSLLNQRGSQVILGQINIIPIKNSLIYVRPLYLKAESGKSLPELKKVIVSYSDKVVMEDNVENALIKLFNIKGAQTPAEGVNEQVITVEELVKKAAEMFNKAKSAQTSGDWAAYGQYLKELENILNILQEKSK